MSIPSKDEVRETLKVLRKNEPLIWAMLMGHGVPITISSVAGMTLRDGKSGLSSLENEGIIVWKYGKSWMFNRSNEMGEQLSNLRPLVKKYKLGE